MKIQSQLEDDDSDPIGAMQADAKQAKLDDFVRAGQSQPEASGKFAHYDSLSSATKQAAQEIKESLRQLRAAPAVKPEASELVPVTDTALISRIQQVRNSVGTIREADAALADRARQAAIAQPPASMKGK